MQTETRTPVQPAIPRQFITVFGFMVNWFGYGFLTFPILIVLSVLLFDYITLFGPQMPFLRYLAWLPGLSSDSDVQVNGDYILLGFSLLSTAFWGLSKLVRTLVAAVRRRLGREVPPEGGQVAAPPARPTLASLARPFLRRRLVAFLSITGVFLVTFIVLPSAKLAHRSDLIGLYLVFFVFYLIAVGSVATHVLIDGASRLLLEWARRQSAGIDGQGG
jgi:hypothetical protein